MAATDLHLPADQTLGILLIDDDRFYLDVWSALLSYVGYRVYCARNCFDAALQLARDVQCVVLDHDLPDMRGVDFIRHFAAPGHPGFVLITTEPSEFLRERALNAGAAAVLAKPAVLGDVVEAIEQACSHVPHVAPVFVQPIVAA